IWVGWHGANQRRDQERPPILSRKTLRYQGTTAWGPVAEVVGRGLGRNASVFPPHLRRRLIFPAKGKPGAPRARRPGPWRFGCENKYGRPDGRWTREPEAKFKRTGAAEQIMPRGS